MLAEKLSIHSFDQKSLPVLILCHFIYFHVKLGILNLRSYELERNFCNIKLRAKSYINAC